MDILEMFILGLTQGLTEFLPVSSSGHLLLLEKLGLGAPSLALNLALHLATLAAVIIFYRKKFWWLISHPFSKQTLQYALACVPTALLAVAFKQHFYGLLMGSYLPTCFMFSAFLMMFADLYKNRRIGFLSNKNAFLTGVMQGIAVLPGISRSGSTIAALTLLGVPKADAKEFSFMLSVPVILGGAIFELVAEKGTLTFEPLPLAVALITAFVAGLFSVWLTGKAVDKGRFLPFSVYLICLSVLSFILLY